MANTPRGVFVTNMAAAGFIRFDTMASMIAAGSAFGYALEAGPTGLASAAFPRAASLYQSNGQYPWTSVIFRSAATTMNWLPDPVGTANASVGIPMFGNDPKPIAFPGGPKDFSAFAVGAGALQMVFLQGDELSL